MWSGAEANSHHYQRFVVLKGCVTACPELQQARLRRGWKAYYQDIMTVDARAAKLMGW
ncbi:hypothetical protein O9993_13165 [Vibrio lentus]|nr:hypothetical protein [Vibrio lentus]